MPKRLITTGVIGVAIASLAACGSAASTGKLTTASMANRYGLSDSTADKFTLYNIGLLATFTLCGPR
jgi:hypothetical protein